MSSWKGSQYKGVKNRLGMPYGIQVPVDRCSIIKDKLVFIPHKYSRLFRKPANLFSAMARPWVAGHLCGDPGFLHNYLKI